MLSLYTGTGGSGILLPKLAWLPLHCLHQPYNNTRWEAVLALSPCVAQVLSMSELVKGAIAEAEAYGKQADVGSGDVPTKVQLGQQAQTGLQVRASSPPPASRHDCLPFMFVLSPPTHVHTPETYIGILQIGGLCLISGRHCHGRHGKHKANPARVSYNKFLPILLCTGTAWCCSCTG